MRHVFLLMPPIGHKSAKRKSRPGATYTDPALFNTANTETCAAEGVGGRGPKVKGGSWICGWAFRVLTTFH